MFTLTIQPTFFNMLKKWQCMLIKREEGVVVVEFKYAFMQFGWLMIYEYNAHIKNYD